jgi:hypothetical protein
MIRSGTYQVRAAAGRSGDLRLLVVAGAVQGDDGVAQQAVGFVDIRFLTLADALCSILLHRVCTKVFRPDKAISSSGVLA